MDRPLPQSLERILNNHAERLRALERYGSKPPEDPDLGRRLPAYTWQSAFALAEGYGHRLHADRNGKIRWVRLERSEGDGDSTATIDVEINNDSIFTDSDLPFLLADERLGDEFVPDIQTFEKGDAIRVNIIDTGGGSGPLRVFIRYDTTGNRDEK